MCMLPIPATPPGPRPVRRRPQSSRTAERFDASENSIMRWLLVCALGGVGGLAMLTAIAALLWLAEVGAALSVRTLDIWQAGRLSGGPF